MAVHAAGFEHRVYVLIAVFTHAALGFALAYAWRAPAAGAVGAAVPDVDFLFSPAWGFPLVHRGLTHTPFFGGVVGGALLAAGLRRRAVLGVAAGHLSHLLVDTFTRGGVMWLYPLSTARVGFDASAHSVEHTAAIWAFALVVWALARRRNATPGSET